MQVFLLPMHRDSNVGKCEAGSASQSLWYILSETEHFPLSQNKPWQSNQDTGFCVNVCDNDQLAVHYLAYQIHK